MAAEDSHDTANDSDSLLELETSVYVSAIKEKVTRTWLKIHQKRWKLIANETVYLVLATVTGVPRLIALCAFFSGT